MCLQAMPVHVRMHQVLTVALLDKDVSGSDEIGRCLHASNACSCCKDRVSQHVGACTSLSKFCKREVRNQLQAGL